MWVIAPDDDRHQDRGRCGRAQCTAVREGTRGRQEREAPVVLPRGLLTGWLSLVCAARPIYTRAGPCLSVRDREW